MFKTNKIKYLFIVLVSIFLAGTAAPDAFALNAPDVGCYVCDPREYKSPERPTKPSYPATNGPCTDAVRNYCQQGILPFCARTKLGCTEIGDIGLTAINYGRFVFGISGSIALLFIIIGGLLMMFSFGNQEKMTKGRNTLVAAVVGLIIIFSAYLIVAFIVKTVDIESVTDVSGKKAFIVPI